MWKDIIVHGVHGREYAVHGRAHYAHLTQASRKGEGSSALQLFSSWQLAAKGSWQQKQAKIECSRMSSAAAQKRDKEASCVCVCVCARIDDSLRASSRQIYKCSNGCTTENKVIKTCSKYVENVTKDAKNKKEENLKEHFYDNWESRSCETFQWL